LRLQKYLSRAGVASRREAERLIVAGRVMVNGALVTELGSRVDPDADVVFVDGALVAPKPTRWVLFYKPVGALTTERDPHGGRTIYDLLPDDFRGLRYVGRLDRETEGLLLLTNDGDLAAELLHPRNAVEREYEAVVKRLPVRDTLDRLVQGVTLEDGLARAKRAELLGERRDEATMRLVLTEGRKREVRRMLEHVGHPVLALKRVRFGPLTLGGVEAGKWRDLGADEIAALVAAVAGEVSG
jgi:pseudouridine synthase